MPKLKIERETVEEVEVELPRYYVYNVGGDSFDCVIYGRITEDKHVTVAIRRLSESDAVVKFEVEAVWNHNHLGCYFKPEYDSDATTFHNKWNEALDFAEFAI